jgi:SLOG cluster2
MSVIMIAAYVLGGFGGAAQQIAAVMSGGRSDALALGSFTANRKYSDLSNAAEDRGRIGELDEKIAWLWEQLQHGEFENGLSKEENAVLWRTANVGLAVALISKGLSRIDPRHRPLRRG